MGKKKIGILTGGGDSPGLNAVIRGVAKTAINQYGLSVTGFLDGFLGLMEQRFIDLTFERVSGILTQGGTILGTTNRANPFAYAVVENGEKKVIDVSDRCAQLYHDLGMEALICLGGDGTMGIAADFAKKGMNVIGVPKTIDKDVAGTDITFGFDSARAMATDAIDRLHTTADAHHRVMLVEVMGRNAGWLALESGIAGGGDIILIPEIPYEISHIVSAIRKRNLTGKKFSIVVVAEGAKPVGGEVTVKRVVDGSPEPMRLGGCSQLIANQIEKESGIECRIAVLGHLQRGGTPSAYDRLLATEFAVKAVELVAAGQYNKMVALRGNHMEAVSLDEVVKGQKTVPLDSPLIKVAQAVGSSFGAELK